MVLRERLLSRRRNSISLQKKIKWFIERRQPTLKFFQRLVEKLRHAPFGIPTKKDLFTPLHTALKGNKAYNKLSSLLISTLRDWRVILNTTFQDPVKARQLFHREPEFLGECDAYQYSIGCVWLQGPSLSNPVVWRLHLPENVITNLVTAKNKTEKYPFPISSSRLIYFPISSWNAFVL